MKILIVDDELVSRKKMEKVMLRYGECDAVDNGRAAIEAYTDALMTPAPYDLITLDVSMPGMGGTEVLLTIRIYERKKSIPKDKQARILMVTSHSDHETVIASIEAGCDDYIKKPFTLERVTQKLKKMGLTS
jgi:two-component system chemotaxis response regulator CheY